MYSGVLAINEERAQNIHRELRSVLDNTSNETTTIEIPVMFCPEDSQNAV